MRHYRLPNCQKGYIPGDDISMTRDEMRRIDEAQDRRRLCREEFEALVAMHAGVQLIEGYVGKLKRHAKHCGVDWRFAGLIKQLDNIMQTMLDKTSVAQVLTMSNTFEGSELVVSATPVDGCINICQKDARIICRAAQWYCTHECLKTSHESHECPLKLAMDTVPGLPVDDDLVVDDCPYRIGGEIND